MAEWIIKNQMPYEGIMEHHCSDAEEVIEYLKRCSGLDLDNITIEPASTRSYYSYEFITAFQEGKVI